MTLFENESWMAEKSACPPLAFKKRGTCQSLTDGNADSEEEAHHVVSHGLSSRLWEKYSVYSLSLIHWMMARGCVKNSPQPYQS
jgi:hypothetical protein